MTVQAALKHVDIGKLVEAVLRSWLDDGALVEELSE